MAKAPSGVQLCLVRKGFRQRDPVAEVVFSQAGKKETQSMKQTLYWTAAQVSPDIATALEVLGTEYPLREGAGEPQLEFVQQPLEHPLRVARTGTGIRISYGLLTQALRGVSAALAGMPEQTGEFVEVCSFSTLGIMVDCSRNAVMQVPYLMKWLRRLALLGYNMVLLYTEDTYQVEGEPFFGFLRGAYSRQELQELDTYAAALGIEMVGCIQTLSNLRRVLKWDAYGPISDTGNTLLVGEPATYDLIRKMVAAYAGAFRSRRLHIGMDEAQDLGRGRYFDLHGYRPPFDIFSEHLTKVAEICREQGVRPMIWSDMYFRIGSKTKDYYDPEVVIPEKVRASIPAGLDIVYWDYYHSSKRIYVDMIRAHRQLGSTLVMGSGVWTWSHLWYDRRTTEENVPPSIAACKEEGITEFFFTMWGDDGAYCEYDSALAGVAYGAAQAYGEPDALMGRRFAAVCGIGYDQVLLGCDLGTDEAALALWDDPLIGLYWLSQEAADPGHWQRILPGYQRLARRLARFRTQTEPVDMAHAALLARYLAAKIRFRVDLEEAYFDRKIGQLENVQKEALRMARLTSQLLLSFRRQWLRRNKQAGLEVLEIRFGGLRERYGEAARLLRDLREGRISSLQELDRGRAVPTEAMAKLQIWPHYGQVATSSSVG